MHLTEYLLFPCDLVLETLSGMSVVFQQVLYVMHRFAWSMLFTLLASSSLASLLGVKLVSFSKGYASKGAKIIISIALAVMALDIRQKAIQVEADRSEEVFNFYMHIWNVFYGCYFLLPLTKL